MELRLAPGELRARTPEQRKVAGLTSWETIYAAGSEIRAHAHENAFIYLVLDGALTEVCDRKARTALPSTVIFHPPEQIHANHFLDAGARAFSLELDRRWLGRLPAGSVSLEAPAYFQGGRLIGLAVQLYQEARETDAASALVVEGLTLELLGEIARRGAAVAARQPPGWLREAKELLHARFAEGLTLAEIGDAVGVHPVHLASVFRRHCRCTVGDYVRRLRVDHACRQLVQSKIPLAEIALDAGFANQSHFTRTFRRLTGTTPARYRKIFAPRPN